MKGIRRTITAGVIATAAMLGAVIPATAAHAVVWWPPSTIDWTCAQGVRYPDEWKQAGDCRAGGFPSTIINEAKLKGCLSVYYKATYAWSDLTQSFVWTRYGNGIYCGGGGGGMIAPAN